MQTASSLTFSSYLVRGRRERRRAAARDEKKKHLLSRLQSRAWSLSCLARFAQRTKKREIARSLRFMPDVKHFSTGVKDFVMFRPRDFWWETLLFLNVI